VTQVGIRTASGHDLGSASTLPAPGPSSVEAEKFGIRFEPIGVGPAIVACTASQDAPGNVQIVSVGSPLGHLYTTVTYGSTAGRVVALTLGSTLICGSFMPKASQTSPENLGGTTFWQAAMGADTAFASENTRDSGRRRLLALLESGEHEDLEIGVASDFTRGLTQAIEQFGPAGVEALANILEVRLPSSIVMSVLLRQLGRVRDHNTDRARRELMTKLLRSNSVQIRHAAAAGLAEMDDPSVIPQLELAVERERHDRPREYLSRVLAQLRDTERCLNSS